MVLIDTVPSMVADLVDSNAMRAFAYGVAGAAGIHAGWRERSQSASRSIAVWPTFWFVTAALLLAMAVGRALDIDELATRFGRSQAQLAGWYRTRRGLQATLVGSVTVTWMIVVCVAIWRVPERRRRYLPAALVVFTIACFAAVRLVSLHHVDALLYNRSIAGVRVVAVVEWCLVGLTIMATYWHPLLSNAPRDHPPAHLARP